MAFTLRIKSSSVAGKVPDASALATAELGLNLVDQKLYSKDANGTVFEIGEAGDTPNGPTPPADGNQLGDLFFDTFNNVLLYWNGVEWVPVGNEAIALNDLTDVDTSGVTDGMVLAYNGSSWVPYDPETFNPQAGRALTYDNNTDPSTLNADLATEATVGVVSVGDGLEVSPLGELSVTPIDIPPGTVVSETAPVDPEKGQMWWADSTVEDGGGRLYVWTGDEWVDASQPGGGSDFGQAEADALYLSKANDDSAAGAITFKGATTHEAGISVTGGNSVTIGTGIVKSGDNLDIFNDGTLSLQAYSNGCALFGRTTGNSGAVNLSYYGGDVSHAVSNVYGLLQQTTFNSGADAFDAYSFYAIGVNNGGATANYTAYGVASSPSVTKNFGFRSDINAEAGKENWAFYSLGSAPSRIPNLSTTFTSFVEISELNQTDNNGNPINWKQPTAATVGTGIFRNAAGALCFARNGECALEIGNGKAIGNLLDKLESLEARLAALEGA